MYGCCPVAVRVGAPSARLWSYYLLLEDIGPPTHCMLATFQVEGSAPLRGADLSSCK